MRELPRSCQDECWVDICWRDTNVLTANYTLGEEHVRHWCAGMLIFKVPRGMLLGVPTNRHVALCSKPFGFLKLSCVKLASGFRTAVASVRPAE